MQKSAPFRNFPNFAFLLGCRILPLFRWFISKNTLMLNLLGQCKIAPSNTIKKNSFSFSSVQVQKSIHPFPQFAIPTKHWMFHILHSCPIPIYILYIVLTYYTCTVSVSYTRVKEGDHLKLPQNHFNIGVLLLITIYTDSKQYIS